MASANSRKNTEKSFVKTSTRNGANFPRGSKEAFVLIYSNGLDSDLNKKELFLPFPTSDSTSGSIASDHSKALASYRSKLKSIKMNMATVLETAQSLWLELEY